MLLIGFAASGSPGKSAPRFRSAHAAYPKPPSLPCKRNDVRRPHLYSLGWDVPASSLQVKLRPSCSNEFAGAYEGKRHELDRKPINVTARIDLNLPK